MLLKGIILPALILALIKAGSAGFWLLPAYFALYYFLLFLLEALFLLVCCATVDLDKPRETESKFFRAIVAPYVEWLMNLFLVKVKKSGLEKIPTDGRFLLVCNHQQMADPGIVINSFPKSQLIFVSKKENRKLPVINKFLHALRCQMLDRDNDRQALKVILECIRILKADEASVCVFPEGYTSRDGRLHHFRSGVFKIAQKAQVPIVVCTINGTAPLFHNLKRLRRTYVDFHLVDVIPAQELAGQTTAQIADRVYEMMIADLGEQFREINT